LSLADREWTNTPQAADFSTTQCPMPPEFKARKSLREQWIDPAVARIGMAATFRRNPDIVP
jgi:hypothetical protein